jgi:hypothetical protein
VIVGRQPIAVRARSCGSSHLRRPRTSRLAQSGSGSRVSRMMTQCCHARARYESRRTETNCLTRVRLIRRKLKAQLAVLAMICNPGTAEGLCTEQEW